ncbi:MAG: hypothetical protein QG602_495 [Verrucomicrobiota bacterium]|nr:hypothetical protein [Verrucomicrobiota bacterium]
MRLFAFSVAFCLAAIACGDRAAAWLFATHPGAREAPLSDPFTAFALIGAAVLIWAPVVALAVIIRRNR